MLSHRAVVALLLVVLSSASALAEWSADGHREPSTAHDRAGGMMFDAPDTSSDARSRSVYLNGFVSEMTTGVTSLTPNAAALRSAFAGRNVVALAIFGVWKDCNGDGYVGAGDNHVGFEYPASLVEAAICPADATDPLSHNDGATVRELIPLVYANPNDHNADGSPKDPDPFDIEANDARVWADFAAPTDAYVAPCQLKPQPPGTYRSTGGALSWLDCQEGYSATHASGGALRSAGLGALAFDDRPDGDARDSASALNVRYPVGAASDPGAVEAFDCSQPPAARAPGPRDPTAPDAGPGALAPLTGSGGYLLTPSVPLYAPHAPTAPPGGSALGAGANVERGSLGQCGDRDGLAATGAAGWVNPWNDTTADYYGCFEDVARMRLRYVQPTYVCETASGADPRGRTRPDALLAADELPRTKDNANLPRGNGELVDANLVAGFPLGRSFFWVSFDGHENQPILTRSGQAAGALWVSTYGYIPPATVAAFGLQLPSAGASGYGAEACARTALDGVARFDCDSGEWWTDLDGRDIAQPNPTYFPSYVGDARIRVGAPYNVRDVDCYDESIGALRDASLTAPALAAGESC